MKSFVEYIQISYKHKIQNCFSWLLFFKSSEYDWQIHDRNVLLENSKLLISLMLNFMLNISKYYFYTFFSNQLSLLPYVQISLAYFLKQIHFLNIMSLVKNLWSAIFLILPVKVMIENVTSLFIYQCINK